jgi:hypothetical protein
MAKFKPYRSQTAASSRTVALNRRDLIEFKELKTLYRHVVLAYIQMPADDDQNGRKARLLRFIMRLRLKCFSLVTYTEPAPHPVRLRLDRTIESFHEGVCEDHFRFKKAQLVILKQVLGIPESFVLYDAENKPRNRFSGEECFLVLLNSFKSGTQMVELTDRFGREATQLQKMFRVCAFYLWDEWGFLLGDRGFERFQPHFREYNRVIKQKALQVADVVLRDAIEKQAQGEYVSPWRLIPLDVEDCHVMGFIDGTCRRSTRPRAGPVHDGEGAPRHEAAWLWQKAFYNSYNKFNGIKYEICVAPSGMVMRLMGPISVKRHDRFLLNTFQTNASLVQTQVVNNGANEPMYQLYGDSAYPLSEAVTRHANFPMTDQERLRAYCFSSCRESVEHQIGVCPLLWRRVNNWWEQKLLRQTHRSIEGIEYKLATLLTNALTCVRSNVVGARYNCLPPTLENYFRK